MCIPDAKVGFKYADREWEATSFDAPEKYVISFHMDDGEQKELEVCHEDNSCPRIKSWGVALYGENQDTYYCGTPKDDFLFLKCTFK